MYRTACFVASAPEPAVVGIATNLQKFFFISKADFLILFFSKLNVQKTFDNFAKSSTAPPPIASIISGRNSVTSFDDKTKS